MFNELMNGWMERLTIVVVMFLLSSVGYRVKKKKAVSELTVLSINIVTLYYYRCLQTWKPYGHKNLCTRAKSPKQFKFFVLSNISN